jgi:hypothetical protein
VLAAVLGVVARAQIKAFTLEEMTQVADSAVYGEIVASRAFRSTGAGPELYFTRLTIAGRSLADATPITVDVTFHGGFIDENEGVFNSEAPAADDVKVGMRVVAFYRWADDMGGGVAGNALGAAHGGLFRTVEGPRGAAVLGRGAGYAIAGNVRLAHLETATSDLYRAKKKR